ncbi:amidase [Oceanicola sp. 22II-s10i]|uniref:amidase n=1 Tax=Oceanicola sp. 22II-s10i TaxID=1317116 RepID=UPI000B51F9A5|nr:amidase [Oceanicola sp. 22II-s10i]OWU86157.1 amidase [Oceanicola sp. 22II-s10i]
MTLIDLSAADLLARIRNGETSCVEAMQAMLDRVAAVNGDINAIVSMKDPDALLSEALAADTARASGADIGPLHGLPLAVKDLANAAGFPTSKGSPIRPGVIAEQDDLAIGRLRAAGAIVVGKTNTPEFGLGSHTFNPVHGPTRNPYDLTRSAGGSSGGAGAALAARMQWACDGSDAMGSLRNPAGWNCCYGFRPSWGRIPPDPETDVVMHPLSTLGPMARDVTDVALLLDVMGGPDPRAPFGPAPEVFSGRIDADLKGRRIAWAADWGGAWPMEEGVLDTCEAALTILADLGCEVERIDPPFPADELWDSWTTLRSLSNVSGRVADYDDPVNGPLLRDVAVWEVERGLALTARDITRASKIRSRWHGVAAGLFAQYDALVVPTAQCFPFPVDWKHPTEIAGRPLDTYHRWMECVIPASLLGLPALGVPAGFGPAGLPIGLQFVGRYGGDLGILQLGQGWHLATEFPQKNPPRI